MYLAYVLPGAPTSARVRSQAYVTDEYQVAKLNLVRCQVHLFLTLASIYRVITLFYPRNTQFPQIWSDRTITGPYHANITVK